MMLEAERARERVTKAALEVEREAGRTRMVVMKDANN